MSRPTHEENHQVSAPSLMLLNFQRPQIYYFNKIYTFKGDLHFGHFSDGFLKLNFGVIQFTFKVHTNIINSKLLISQCLY